MVFFEAYAESVRSNPDITQIAEGYNVSLGIVIDALADDRLFSPMDIPPICIVYGPKHVEILSIGRGLQDKLLCMLRHRHDLHPLEVVTASKIAADQRRDEASVREADSCARMQSLGLLIPFSTLAMLELSGSQCTCRTTFLLGQPERHEWFDRYSEISFRLALIMDPTFFPNQSFCAQRLADFLNESNRKAHVVESAFAAKSLFQ